MQFLIGYSRVCITPTESVPLAGYGATSKRMSTCVTRDLYTTCIAFTDKENNTVLMVSNDLILSSADWTGEARKAMSEATGVPEAHILVSATHTHSGPDMGNLAHESILNYRKTIVTLMTQAALEAMADRKEGKLYFGKTYIEGVNHVRHYVLDNGTFVGDNFGDASSGKLLRSTTEADHCMQIIRAERKDAQDIVMVNWQTHPHREGGGKKTNISSDIVDCMRQTMEARAECRFAYFSGAGGNINSTSRIKQMNLPGIDAACDASACGSYMAYHAYKALDTLQPLGGDTIKTCAHTVSVSTDHTKDHLVDIARKLREDWERTGDHAACKEAGKPYGIHSPYHAGAIVGKSKQPPTRDVNLWAVSVGDLAFVGAPYEMFDTNGDQIKRGSPFSSTFVCTCCNEYVGYIPSAYGYAHGCYEADCTPIAPGSGELLALEFITMLAKLWK